MSEENETMEVDLGGGIKATLPKADAQKFIADRDLKVKTYNDQQAQLQAQSDAESNASEKAKQEEEKRIAVEAAQKGELDLLNNHHAAQLMKRDGEILSVSIQAALASRKDLVVSALPDVSAMLANSGEIVWENGQALHKNSDGTTQALSVYLDTWLEARPHYKTSTMPTKQSGDKNPDVPSDVDSITRQEYDKNPKKYLQQIAARKLIVKD